jgi:hypothetical protein
MRSIVAVAVLTVVLALSSAQNAYAARESVQVTKLANPVTIDGKWTTPSEWSDTNRVSMYLLQGPQSTAYVRLKHDADYLYILADFISDTTQAIGQTKGDPPEDGLNMGIDKDVNDTNVKCCDLYVHLYWTNGKSAPEPIDPAWLQGTISYDARNDPDSKSSHAIYELAIPMGTFEKNSAFRISVWDAAMGVNMQWPQYKGSWSMEYFGDLMFSDVVVPELPSPALFLLLSLVVTYAIVRRRKCFRKEVAPVHEAPI